MKNRTVRSLNPIMVMIGIVILLMLLIGCTDSPTGVEEVEDEDVFSPVVVYKKSSLDGFEEDVWIADSKGNERRVTNYSDSWDGISFSQQWYEGGERIAYLRRGDEGVYSVNLKGEDRIALTDNEVSYVYTFKISNDGERIAFVGQEASEDGSQLSPTGIYVKNINTNETTLITETEGGGFDVSIGWSPNDERIVFSDIVDDEYSNLFIMNSDGSGDAQNITNFDSFDILPVWSPFEEDKIIFYSDRSGSFATYIMSSNGSSLQQVTNEPVACMSWVSNEELVCFGQNGNQSDLFKLNLNGSSQILFDWPETNERFPDWRRVN